MDVAMRAYKSTICMVMVGLADVSRIWTKIACCKKACCFAAVLYLSR